MKINKTATGRRKAIKPDALLQLEEARLIQAVLRASFQLKRAPTLDESIKSYTKDVAKCPYPPVLKEPQSRANTLKRRGKEESEDEEADDDDDDDESSQPLDGEEVNANGLHEEERGSTMPFPTPNSNSSSPFMAHRSPFTYTKDSSYFSSITHDHPIIIPDPAAYASSSFFPSSALNAIGSLYEEEEEEAESHDMDMTMMGNSDNSSSLFSFMNPTNDGAAEDVVEKVEEDADNRLQGSEVTIGRNQPIDDNDNPNDGEEVPEAEEEEGEDDTENESDDEDLKLALMLSMDRSERSRKTVVTFAHEYGERKKKPRRGGYGKNHKCSLGPVVDRNSSSSSHYSSSPSSSSSVAAAAAAAAASASYPAPIPPSNSSASFIPFKSLAASSSSSSSSSASHLPSYSYSHSAASYSYSAPALASSASSSASASSSSSAFSLPNSLSKRRQRSRQDDNGGEIQFNPRVHARDPDDYIAFQEAKNRISRIGPPPVIMIRKKGKRAKHGINGDDDSEEDEDDNDEEYVEEEQKKEIIAMAMEQSEVQAECEEKQEAEEQLPSDLITTIDSISNAKLKEAILSSSSVANAQSFIADSAAAASGKSAGAKNEDSEEKKTSFKTKQDAMEILSDVDPYKAPSIKTLKAFTPFKSREDLAESGVHWNLLSNIHGAAQTGCFSVILEHMYEPDVDHGHTFTLTLRPELYHDPLQKMLSSKSEQETSEVIEAVRVLHSECPSLLATATGDSSQAPHSYLFKKSNVDHCATPKPQSMAKTVDSLLQKISSSSSSSSSSAPDSLPVEEEEEEEQQQQPQTPSSMKERLKLFKEAVRIVEKAEKEKEAQNRRLNFSLTMERHRMALVTSAALRQPVRVIRSIALNSPMCPLYDEIDDNDDAEGMQYRYDGLYLVRQIESITVDAPNSASLRLPETQKEKKAQPSKRKRAKKEEPAPVEREEDGDDDGDGVNDEQQPEKQKQENDEHEEDDLLLGIEDDEQDEEYRERKRKKKQNRRLKVKQIGRQKKFSKYDSMPNAASFILPDVHLGFATDRFQSSNGTMTLPRFRFEWIPNQVVSRRAGRPPWHNQSQAAPNLSREEVETAPIQIN